MRRTLNLPVMLVVGLRLGCISHVVSDGGCDSHGYGLKPAAWFGNGIDPSFDTSAERVVALAERLRAGMPRLFRTDR